MSMIVDLVIIGIIALCIIVGYIKGLTGSLIKIVSFALSLVVAFVLFVPVSNFIINNTPLDNNLEKSIRELVLHVEQTKNEPQTEEQKNVPIVITNYISQKIEEAANEAKENIVNSTARDVTETIVKAGTWIALFIIARIAFILLKFVTALIAKLPVIKQCDKLGGIVYGLLKGLVITYVALAIISFVTPMTNGELSERINESHIGSFMYNHNLLLNIIF